MPKRGYQACFIAGKNCVSKCFIMRTCIFHSTCKKTKQHGVLLIDYRMYFDSIRRGTIFNKLRKEQVPTKLQRTVWRATDDDLTQLNNNGDMATKLRLTIGAGQGSAWSPWKGLAGADANQDFVCDGLEHFTGEAKNGLITITDNGPARPSCMFAGDFFHQAIELATLQQFWDLSETATEHIGSCISYPKIELQVWNFDSTNNVDNPPWTIHGKHGNVTQRDSNVVKYVGMWVATDNWDHHFNSLRDKMESANAILLRAFADTDLKCKDVAVHMHDYCTSAEWEAADGLVRNYLVQMTMISSTKTSTIFSTRLWVQNDNQRKTWFHIGYDFQC